jgi:hypothetical protein
VTPRRSRLLAWIALAVALLVAGYSCLAYVMLGSFSVAGPARTTVQTAAWIYLGLMGLSVVAAIAAIVFLARRRSNVTTSHRK